MSNILWEIATGFMWVSIALYLWTYIVKDLVQIRAAQKLEIEAIARLAKLLDKEHPNDD